MIISNNEAIFNKPHTETNGSPLTAHGSLKKAFTLAELLITLAIVGIVAALTLPTLISKIQEYTFHTKWKECYSLLHNAFEMVKADNPDMLVRASDGKLSPEFVKAFLSKLYVVDTCGDSKYADNNCSNLYSQTSNSWTGVAAGNSVFTKYLTLSGAKLNSYDFGGIAALLKNGASIYIGGSHSDLTILVDVNNFTGGPNMVGKDVYAINIITTKKGWRFEKTRITEAEFMPFGAPGSRCMTDSYRCSISLGPNEAGVRGCSADVGYTNEGGYTDWLVTASGLGCSYKYLHEK